MNMKAFVLSLSPDERRALQIELNGILGFQEPKNWSLNRETYSPLAEEITNWHSPREGKIAAIKSMRARTGCDLMTAKQSFIKHCGS